MPHPTLCCENCRFNISYFYSQIVGFGKWLYHIYKAVISQLIQLIDEATIWDTKLTQCIYILQVNSLEQTPREKCILNTCLAVIIAVAVGLYAFFSISPLSAEETESLRMEAFNRSLYHGNSTSQEM